MILVISFALSRWVVRRPIYYNGYTTMEDTTFNILSFDPGSNFGVSVNTIHATELSIVGVATHLLDLNKYAGERPSEVQANRLFALRKYITSLCVVHKPKVVVIESCFSGRFPKALIQLSGYIAIVENACREYDNSIPILRYAPKEAKKLFTGSGNADKDAMKTTLLDHVELAGLVDATTISEHEVDAVAIGYCGLLSLRKFPFGILRM